MDVQRVANDLILSKHFDYGMICATEQAIIAHKDIYAPLVKELKRRKAYFVNDEEKAKLEQYMFGCTAYSGQTPKLNASTRRETETKTPPSGSAPASNDAANTAPPRLASFPVTLPPLMSIVPP